MNGRLRQRVLATLFACAAALSALGAAAAQGALRPNLEYREVAPQPVLTGPRIEVVEFFWYGCPFCNQLQAPLDKWLQQKPDDVELRRIPAIFRESWVPHARLYYTLEELGELPRLHYSVYRAIHAPQAERETLLTADSTADWATRNGIERSRWLTAYSSADVDRKVEAARSATRNYQIQGTPSLVVDGRLVTSTGMSESVPGIIPILEGLIGMARERRSAVK